MSEFKVKFRGVRGSFPVADKKFLKYGGNTSCVEVNVGGHVIILDAGTGIVGVGLEATEEIEEQNIDAIEQILRSIVELENKVDSGGSGEAGGYYAPAVDADGNLTWTTSKADMPMVDGANIKGPQGKSSYQYAQEGGYTGTEAEFAEKLAQEQLTGTTNELTPTQVYDAVSAGIPVKVKYTDSTYGLLSFTAFNVAESLNVIVSQAIVYYNGVYILAELFGNKSNNSWGFKSTILAQKTDIPTDDHINSLIDTKLGVIENGAY